MHALLTTIIYSLPLPLPPPPPPPLSPLTVAGTPITDFTANRTGYDSASLSWNALLAGTPPVGYEVFYQLTAGGCIFSGGNTSNYTDWTDIRKLLHLCGELWSRKRPCATQ